MKNRIISETYDTKLVLLKLDIKGKRFVAKNGV
jgi:hypothetical protein